MLTPIPTFDAQEIAEISARAKDAFDIQDTLIEIAAPVYVVGDLLSIMSQLKDKGLPIEISVDKTVITYSEPVIKVLIGSDGKIAKGTWSCNVEISLSDYKFAGSTVDSTRVVLNNKITAGGGF